MVPFAGWEMPVLYRGIFEEHRAVRAHAGLFDVSHMGEFRLRGRDAARFAQRAFTNDVLASEPGRARYGMLCLESGGVVDDVTVYRLGADEILLCVNASNVAADWSWLEELRRAEQPDCELVDESDATALLALQGPASPTLLRKLLPAVEPPRPWRFTRGEIAGVPVLVAATGYTGERGYELYAPAEAACRLWDACVEAGGAELALAGLGARDTLRTEMGYPLYGHELDREHDPVEAGLERFLAFGRGFVGEPALVRVRERGPARRLVGLFPEGRQVARTGAAILAGPEPADPQVGTVTSGTFGPTVERSIAIGYVAASHATPGTRLALDVRGRRVACEVTRTPFHRRNE
jgi:aminomethyltransferase